MVYLQAKILDNNYKFKIKLLSKKMKNLKKNMFNGWRKMNDE